MLLAKFITLILMLYIPLVFADFTPVREPSKIYFPNNYKSKANWPLVIVLHGFKVSGKFQTTYFGLKSRMNSKGFVLLVPGSIKDQKGNRIWNATDFCCDHFKIGEDDVKFLTNKIRETVLSNKIDPNRVYIIGHSAGGFMAHRLACESSDLITGIVSLAGSIYKNPEKCKPTEAVSIFEVHAVKDKTVLYYGNTPEILAQPKGNHHYPGSMVLYPGASDTIQQWLKNNECQNIFTDGGPTNYSNYISGKETTLRTWKSCKQNSEVSFWTLNDGGHVPILNNKFKDDILNFLFAHAKIK